MIIPLTPFCTLSLVATAGAVSTVRANNFSSSFNAQTDYLIVQFTASGTLGNTDLLSISIAAY